MQRIISTDVLAAVSEEGFSLDELVYKTRALFEAEGLPGLVAMILGLVDEALSRRLVQGGPGWRPKACCSGPGYEWLDRQDRRIRTSLGKVHLRWRRLRCRVCGKTCTPLREFLGLVPHQSKSSELEQMVLEVISEQSYRRSSEHFQRIGRIPVPRMTAHRWVASSECDRLSPGAEPLQVLMADGTGYKRRPNAAQGLDNQGETAFGVGDSGRRKRCTAGQLERGVLGRHRQRVGQGVCGGSEAGEAVGQRWGAGAAPRAGAADGGPAALPLAPGA